MQPTPPRGWLVRGGPVFSLLEGLQEGHDLGGFVVGQADVGHGRAWLEGGRVEDPFLEIVWTVDGHRAAGDCGAAGRAGQVRADLAVGARNAGDGVAADARLGGDDLSTFGSGAAGLED